MTKTIGEILAVAEDPAYHRVVTARISVVPQSLRDEHAELNALLLTLTSDTIDAHPDRDATADRLVEIEAEIEESIIEFRFKAIGHRAWADLLREHPPTDAQRRRDRQLDHNPDTFPYEAMAVSCVEPAMTADEVRRLEASALMDVQSWTQLWSACLRANVADRNPKSVAASIRRLNGESARQLTTTESHEASFSDE